MSGMSLQAESKVRDQIEVCIARDLPKLVSAMQAAPVHTLIRETNKGGLSIVVEITENPEKGSFLTVTGKLSLPNMKSEAFKVRWEDGQLELL
jgi:hypothetical protein